MRSILTIRRNLAEGRPSQCDISKQFGKLQLDFSIKLRRPGQEAEDGKQGLRRRVSEMVFSKLKQGEPRNKGTKVKKSGGNPFVEHLARMEGTGPKIGPTLANLAALRRIL